jgi:hypothetical protein
MPTKSAPRDEKYLPYSKVYGKPAFETDMSHCPSEVAKGKVTKGIKDAQRASKQVREFRLVSICPRVPECSGGDWVHRSRPTGEGSGLRRETRRTQAPAGLGAGEGVTNGQEEEHGRGD